MIAVDPSQHSGRRHGSTLLLVIIFTAIMFLVVVSALHIQQFRFRMAYRIYDQQRAMALAEAGAEYAINQINQKLVASFPWSATQSVSNHAGQNIGQFLVTATNGVGANVLIESTGYLPSINHPKAKRTVRVNSKGDEAPSFFEWGIYSYGLIHFDASFKADSYNSSAGPYPGWFANSNARIGASAGANLEYTSNNQIHGNVQVGGTISGSPAIITGTQTQHDPAKNPPPFPDADLAAAMASNNNSQITVGVPPAGPFAPPPANFWTGGQTGGPKIIKMPPGVYYFNNEFKLGSSVQIQVDPPGPVKVYINSSSGYAFRSGSGCTINANTAKPINFQMYVKKGDIQIQSGSTYAAVYAPFSAVHFTASAGFFGGVVGNGVEFNSPGGFHYDESLGNATPGSAHMVTSWAEVTLN